MKGFIIMAAVFILESHNVSVGDKIGADSIRYVSQRDARQIVDTFKASEGDVKGKGPYYQLSTQGDYYIVSIGYADVLGVEYYAVDRRTGDLWEANFCHEDSSAKLREMQRKVRRSLGITDAVYRKLRKPGPMCS